MTDLRDLSTVQLHRLLMITPSGVQWEKVNNEIRLRERLEQAVRDLQAVHEEHDPGEAS